MNSDFEKPPIKLSNVFLISALFFAFFSFFGVYSYKVYDYFAFVLFFAFELLFYLGLKSGGVYIGHMRRKEKCKFYILPQNETILLVLNIISIGCFLYFLSIYLGSFSLSNFGIYTADTFEDSGRTSLEKFTLLLMQIGGESVFLIVSAASDVRSKWLRRFSNVCLFLPGIRYLLMGSRYTLAVEFLLFIAVKWRTFSSPDGALRTNFRKRKTHQKALIIILGIVVMSLFLWLFSTRSIYYTAVERKLAYSGDMTMKTFWRNLYDATDGKIDFLCTFSDYLGEAPYVFSYYYKYEFPETTYGGLLFRSILQILNAFGIGEGYSGVASKVAGGQYSGIGYSLIADFGVPLGLFAAYLIGLIIAKVERGRKSSRVSAVIYPAVKVICFFAPVYYFTVGRIDYVILFAIPMSVIFLNREYDT